MLGQQRRGRRGGGGGGRGGGRGEVVRREVEERSSRKQHSRRSKRPGQRWLAAVAVSCLAVRQAPAGVPGPGAAVISPSTPGTDAAPLAVHSNFPQPDEPSDRQPPGHGPQIARPLICCTQYGSCPSCPSVLLLHAPAFRPAERAQSNVFDVEKTRTFADALVQLSCQLGRPSRTSNTMSV